jgi:hypothetical protein
LAAASPSVDDLTAKIIDRVATLNPEKLHDGAFRKEYTFDIWLANVGRTSG